MPKCILHVGMHKTGTTSIQNSLKSLDDENFYYARLLGRPNHSLSVHSVFAKLTEGRMRNKRFTRGGLGIQEKVALAKRDLAQSIEAAKRRTLVISGEGIIRMKPVELKRLKDYLVEHGYDDVEVVAYIRSPMAYVSSAAQQKIKARHSTTLKIKGSMPQYRAKFEKFDQIFGRDKVRLFKFAPENFEGNDVVLDFIGKLGIPEQSIQLIRKNESITRLAAKLRFQYSAHMEAEGRGQLRSGMGSSLCHRLRLLDTTRFRLAPSLLRPYVDMQRDDIAWMEDRLGQSLAEDATDDPMDISSEADLLQPVAGIDERLRGILAEDGVPVSAEKTETTVELLEMIARAASKNRHQSAEDGKHRDEEEDEEEENASELADGEDSSAMRAARRAARRPALGEEVTAGRDGEHAERATGIRRGRQNRLRKEAGEAGELSPEARRLRRRERIAARRRAQPLDAGLQKLAEPVSSDPERHQNGRPRAQARQKASTHPLFSDLSPQEAGLIKHFKAMKNKAAITRSLPKTPLTLGPTPLLNPDKKMIVLWSPKSACTTLYVWFSHVSGFSDEVRSYAAWPHRHRSEKYMTSDFYIDAATSGMPDATVLRVIRDPYGRAVSIYRHALQTRFAEEEIASYSGGRMSPETGLSFQAFLDMLTTLDMRRVDMHFRPQFHPYEKKHTASRVINISKQDLFTELNVFEAQRGLPKTNFEDLNWLHNLESKRKAKQEAMEGEALDCVSFSRRQARSGHFPSYDQLLTPEARAKIEAIYKVDFDAYRDFL